MSIRHNNLDYRFSPISVINRYNSHDCYRFLSIDYSGYSYHGALMRALRSRSLRCNQNLHYAQKPGRKTGSKQGDSLVSPLPLHKLSKLQYVPCYDWCNDIFSKSGFPRTPGVVFGTTGYIHAQNLIISNLVRQGQNQWKSHSPIRWLCICTRFGASTILYWGREECLIGYC